MKSAMKWIRHNQGLTVSFAICFVLLIWTFGCESKVSSLIDSGKMVTLTELDLEIAGEIARLNLQVDSLIRRGELKQDQLVKLDAAKKQLFELASLAAATGGVNIPGLLALVGTITGAGLLVDNRIKDKVIKNRPLKPVAG